jgi:alkanesulfonate monooxygenase SsuD/methylene tetrahydromethanopterin reductase-like flavin-dependent oxidoreductase (luciferase family)
LLRRLWAEQVVSYESDNYWLPGVVSQPKPVQKPSIPIVVGGTSSAALRRAAQLADGWIQAADGSDFDDLADKMRRLDAARTDAGRAGLPWEVTSRLGGTYEQARQCADLGVARVLVAGPIAQATPMTVDDFIDWIRQYADDVISRV